MKYIKPAIIPILLGILIGMMYYIIATQSNAPEDGRKVLCIGILANTENPARNVPQVISLCSDVGIEVTDYDKINNK